MTAGEFVKTLNKYDINTFCGVPDSLLKDLCFFLDDNKCYNIITANEGNAIGMACGYYLATKRIAAVYLQNSGLGNCINPLVSLADEKVYDIPLLMIIGLRGEYGIPDEPQHAKQGAITTALLETIGIEYKIIDNLSDANDIIFAINHIMNNLKPFAFIIKKGAFDNYRCTNKENHFEINREYAIKNIIDNSADDDIVVSSTGFISRELYEYRESLGNSHVKDFLTVGSMGHSSSIALAIALEKQHRNVICIEGDGSFLMHMGVIPIIAKLKPGNFKHIILNNEAHDSVGGEATASTVIDFKQLALSCGYKNSYLVETNDVLSKTIKIFFNDEGPSLLTINVSKGARKDLGRPKEKLIDNKNDFMFFLNDYIYTGIGSIKNLYRIIRNYERVLVFTGKKVFGMYGNIFDDLKDKKLMIYSDFSSNPKDIDVDKAINKIDSNFDIIVAFGGGSVIDFAKLYKYFSKCSKPLVAIPTTAGTGSEVTHFAVYYKQCVKISIEDIILKPNFAIVDAQFLLQMSRELKIATALDSLIQAVESYWSNRSTVQSKNWARRSILLSKNIILKYINTNNIEYAEKMALASFFSGRAIDISKTTVSHALSYPFTSEYDIPHGYAVALSINKLFSKNFDINQSNLNDTRGINYVNQTMHELEILLGGREYFCDLFEKIRLQTKITMLNITNIEELIKKVNISRLKNNPRIFTQNELLDLFDY
jgi:phosphonopyruvate decarboxylase